MRALVVDDQSTYRKLFHGLLSRMGHHVDCAENGRDAVLLFISAAEQGNPYNFISMDNEMPVMNGTQAVEMIRAWEKDHRSNDEKSIICFVSGDIACGCKFRNQYGNDCLTRFMQKPIDIEQFIELAKKSENNIHRHDCEIPECLKQAAAGVSGLKQEKDVSCSKCSPTDIKCSRRPK